MNTLALSTRPSSVSLLEESIRQRRKGEYRRLRVCARLAQLIAEIVDRYPGVPYKQVAAMLGPHEGSYLLELIDRLEAESQVYEPVPR